MCEVLCTDGSWKKNWIAYYGEWCVYHAVMQALTLDIYIHGTVLQFSILWERRM